MEAQQSTRRPRHTHSPVRVVRHTHLRWSRLRRVARVVHWRAWGRLAHGRTRPVRRRIAVVLMLLASLIGAAVIGGVMLARARPAWWRPMNPADPRIEELAQAVENGLTTLLNDKRPGDTQEERGREWSMSIDAESANAWLNTRLPRWAVSQGVVARWPEQLREVQVAFDDGTIGVGVRLVWPADGAEQYLAARLQSRFDERGQLWMVAESCTIGRLPVPASWALPRADGLSAAAGKPGGAAAMNALRGAAALLADASLRLPDGRRVRLLGLHSSGGKLVITCRTEEGALHR